MKRSAHIPQRKWVSTDTCSLSLFSLNTAWNSLPSYFGRAVYHNKNHVITNTDVCLFTNKQEILTLLHLRSFRQFQNLSEEIWSRAAENLIELCFVAFLSNKSKKCFILVWVIFLSPEIIAILILHCIVWTFWQQTLKSQWTEIWC